MNLDYILNHVDESDSVTIALAQHNNTGKYFLYSVKRFQEEKKFPMWFYNIINISFEKQTIYIEFEAERYVKHLEAKSKAISKFF